MGIKRPDGILYAFADEYGEAELEKIAQRIISAAVDKCNYEKVCTPFPPSYVGDISLAEIEKAQEDIGCLYVLPEGAIYENPTYVFEDEAYTQKLGTLDKNVARVSIADITADKLAKLVTSSYKCKVEELESRKKAYSKAKIKEFAESRVVARRKELERNIEQSRGSYRSSAENLVYYARQIETQTRELLGFKEDAAASKQLEEDIDELYLSTKLRNVEFGNDELKFFTNEISITDVDGYIHPIGEFEVQLKMSSARLKFINHFNKIAGSNKDIPHPHCNESGEPCLGNIGAVVPELCANYDVLGLWQILLSFLQSYNPDDVWGKQLRYWPAYDEEGNPIDITAEYECSMCGCMLYEEDIYTCDKCGRVMCSDCYVMSDNEYALCDNCSVYCEACDEYHSADDVTMHVCDECGRSFCEERNDWIEQGGEYYCSPRCYPEDAEEEDEDE